MAQVLQNRLRRHRSQVKLQAARQHSGGHFLGVRRGQYKFEVFGRFFQRFEHGVKSRVRQHVHLVNHEDLEAPDHRLVNSLLQQLRDFINAAVGRRVQLGVVHKPSAINIRASLANPARGSGNTALPVSTNAVERLGQNTRNRRFAHTPCARKQVGMVQTLGGQGIAQGLHHMRLPDHFREVFRAVFASQDEIRHAHILKWRITYNRQ